jgi:peptidoglycan/xylan/chitin deacetylase (PgdA/CDA1 family)
MAWLIHAAYRSAYYLGIIRLFYWLNRRAVIVLTYHNVIPDRLFEPTPHLGVSHAESIFREQMRLIARRFRTSSWPAQPGDCVITFDDGYINQWHVAGPILKEFNCPAIYFVPFQPLEDKRCLTVDEILKWISYAPPGDYEIEGAKISLLPEARGDAFAVIYALLLHHPYRWDSILAELDRAVNFATLEVDPEMARLRFTPLNAAELDAIRSRGHQVGCHSWNHRPLGSLPPAQLKEDFAYCKSRRDLYANTRLYSYPFGSSTDEVSNETARECAESGFEAAFINCDAVPALASDPAYAISRTSLPNSADRYVLEAKLSGFERALKRLLRR